MKRYLSLITLTTVYFFGAGAFARTTPSAKPTATPMATLVATAPVKPAETDISGQSEYYRLEKEAIIAKKCIDKDPPAGMTREECRDFFAAKEDPCKDLVKTALEKKEKLGETCAKAHMGSIEQCKEKAEDCQSMEEDNADGIEQLTAGLGVSSYTKKCPASTDQPKTIKTDLKEKQKELADLKKEMVKDEKDAADSFEKLQKEISELQENYDKKNLEIDDSERKRQAETTKALQDITAAIEANNAQMLEAQATLSGLEGKKAENLSNLSDAIIKTDCEAAVRKLEESLKASSSSSNGGMIKQGAKKIQNLKLRYAQCIEAKNQARTSIITASQKETEKINFSIERLKADSARKQTNLNQIQADAAKAATDAKTSKDVATQKLTADKQRLTNKLQNLLNSTQKQTTNNQTRLTELTADVNKSSNELAMIGGGTVSINATFSDAISARSAYNSAVKNWGEKCSTKASDTNALKKDYEGVVKEGSK